MYIAFLYYGVQVFFCDKSGDMAYRRYQQETF